MCCHIYIPRLFEMPEVLLYGYFYADRRVRRGCFIPFQEDADLDRLSLRRCYLIPLEMDCIGSVPDFSQFKILRALLVKGKFCAVDIAQCLIGCADLDDPAAEAIAFQ